MKRKSESKGCVVIDPYSRYPISFASLIRSLIGNRQLIMQMIKREVLGRYKGSFMGLAWSFFHPVFMLSVYTIVFSMIFESRWGGGVSVDKSEFSVLLFVGMIVLGLFTEVLNRSPIIVSINVNYVKKVVFPLEVLPVVAVGAAIVHCMMSVAVLIAALVLLNGYVHWTFLFVFLVLLPLVVLTVGLSWVLSSVGVYVKDISQTMGIITTVMTFLSPVFYPVSAVPNQLKPLLMINPLTFIIEQSREVLIMGHLPNFTDLAIYMVLALISAWIGYVIFQKTRKGFSDVL